MRRKYCSQRDIEYVRCRTPIKILHSSDNSGSVQGSFQKSSLPSIRLRFESAKIRLPPSASREIHRKALNLEMKLTLNKLRAIMRRDLLTAARHRSAFVMTLVGVFTELAAFYFLSRAIGPTFRPGGTEYFPFLLVGTGLYTFFLMSAQAFLNSVQEAQQTGTLEVLMTTSTAPAELIILSSISSFSGNLFNLAIYLFAGVAIFRAPIHANLLSCALVLILSLLIGLAVGIAAATLQVAFQKGSAVLWLLSSGLWFLSGAMFPIQSLPGPLEFLARALPLTYAIDAMRSGLLEGRSVSQMAPALAILTSFVVVLLPLSLGGLSLSLRRARQNGTLSFY
jgi:ABC-type polysaccharide/polyol phosphate export permease